MHWSYCSFAQSHSYYAHHKLQIGLDDYLIAFQDSEKVKAWPVIQHSMKTLKQGTLSNEEAGKQLKLAEGDGRNPKVREIPEGLWRKDNLKETSGAARIAIPEDEDFELYNGDGQDISPETLVDQEMDEENVEREMQENPLVVTVDGTERSTAAQAEGTEVETDNIKQQCLTVLQKFVDLLNKERSGLTSSEAGSQLISFFNSHQVNIRNTCRKILAESGPTRNEDLIEHLTQTACDHANSPQEECSMDEEMAEQEAHMEPEEPYRSIGDYILIKCGKTANSMLPACIIRRSPLVVRYFTRGPSGLYSASHEDYDVLAEDIVRALEPPQPVQRGSRIYYKFDAVVWPTHCFVVFVVGPCMIIPPTQRSCLGVYWFHSVRPSVCPSVRPSVRPSRIPCPLCSIYSSGWILSIFGTNDQQHQRVCRMCWPLTLTYIFKVIRPWLRKLCPLCSVYSSGLIHFIFGTNDHYY